ncbi:MAG: AMP-binding protein [Bacteroidia bacterium]|nr:AMP-binding protein [Bacteroidia bacterium]
MKLFSTRNAFREAYVDTLAKLYEYATGQFPKRLMSTMADAADVSYTYAGFKSACDDLSKRLTQFGIGARDKVAIYSQNMPNWTVAFFSAVPFGRIAVPILPESSENEVTNILTHSESKVLFVSRRLLHNVTEEAMKHLVLVIDIETFEIIRQDEEAFTCDGKVAMPMPDDIAAIIYTSGTTGNAKGVVLSHRNLTSCIKSCYHCCKRHSYDRWLSILPMSHTLEMTICMLYPMYVGGSVYYISKPPVPSLLLKVMQEVRPTTMLSVPLIIEKIYRNSIVPTIRKSPVLTWLQKNMPFVLYRIIGMKLRQTFGGQITFFGIGGAKLDTEVETFLLKANFPYAIGYGLTETSPLLSFMMGRNRTPGSIGIPCRGVTLKLYNPDPLTGEGEIVAKGPNVMLGYYKDPNRTREAFTPDGWFRTNDLACLDEKGRYHIKGRLNNMILGPSGENIYPEEIEQLINGIETVNESVIVSRQGKLVALVNFDENAIDWNHEGEEEFFKKLEEKKQMILGVVNKNVNKTSKVSDVQVMKEPFEKTATRKIRRFKYTNTKGL